jgi:hypothetical protein
MTRVHHSLSYWQPAAFLSVSVWFQHKADLPSTVAARCKVWTAFARSNAGIVSSNRTRCMDVCVYSVFVLVAALRWADPPFKEVLLSVLWLRNWSETKRFTDALCSKFRATRERERESGLNEYHYFWGKFNIYRFYVGRYWEFYGSV